MGQGQAVAVSCASVHCPARVIAAVLANSQWESHEVWSLTSREQNCILELAHCMHKPR